MKGVFIPELNINEDIKSKKLLVIAPDGVQIGELELKKALVIANELDLDLVEVSPESKPPVARLMDYGKYKYELSQKAKPQSPMSLFIMSVCPKAEFLNW